MARCTFDNECVDNRYTISYLFDSLISGKALVEDPGFDFNSFVSDPVSGVKNEQRKKLHF